jgi:hypothetical protein
MNNSSLVTADRSTHLKVVVVSLVAAIVVVAVGIAARAPVNETTTARVKTDGRVIQAGKPVTVTVREGATVR